MIAHVSQEQLRRDLTLLPYLIAIAMLVGCLGHWPYGYYTALRWVVCATAFWIAYGAVRIRRHWVLWPFVAVALLYNPAIPIHLSRRVWVPVDLVVAAFFLVGLALRYFKSPAAGAPKKARPASPR